MRGSVFFWVDMVLAIKQPWKSIHIVHVYQIYTFSTNSTICRKCVDLGGILGRVYVLLPNIKWIFVSMKAKPGP